MADPAQSARQRKAWKLARALRISVSEAMLNDPDLAYVDYAVRATVAKAAGIVSKRKISDHTWKLAIAHAKQLRRKSNDG